MRQSHRATKKKLKPVQLTGPGIFLQKRAPELIAASLLLVIGAMLLCPSTLGQSTHALCLDGSEECTTTTFSTELAITTNTAISLAMSPSVTMEVVPTSTGATSSASTKLAVSTNSKDGYALYMQTGNSTGDLLSTSTTNTISKISNTTLANTSLEGLEKNTYGYAISTTAPDSNTKYSTLPTQGGVIQKTDSTTGSNGDNYIYGDTYYLAFGTKVGTDLEAGSYTGTVTVSAVANPKTLASMFDLTYMQEMSSDICTNTREGYTKQLVDTRDGKSYWVAKLKDGNCWMTQNLAFTITQEMIDNGSINSSNTDIAFTWGNTPAWTDIESWKALGEEYTEENYPGEYIEPVATYASTTETDMTIISQMVSSWALTKTIQVWPEYFHHCQSFCEGFLDVSSEKWQPTFQATKGEYTLSDGSTETGIIAADLVNKTYDAHYLTGNYYQSNAATAGTMGEDTDNVAIGSICPKGWKLSLAGNFNESGGLKYLFDAYGLTGSTTTNAQYSLIGEPFYIPRAGYINSYDTSHVALALVGSNGYLLTATMKSGLTYYPSEKQLDRSAGGTLGMPTRCLAK